MMSLVALSGGGLLYAFLYRTGRTMIRHAAAFPSECSAAVRLSNVLLIRGAGSLARRLFPSGLQAQMSLIVGDRNTGRRVAPDPGRLVTRRNAATPLDPLFALLWAGGAACALGAAYQAKFHRLAALILVGGTGLATCITFAWYSAPDLALTQVAVETVTLVLILLGLRWLPRRIARNDPLALDGPRHAHVAVATCCWRVAAGAGMSALAFAVLTRSGDSALAPYFLANALEQAGGLNVVNVMLVDFRGFDTLGEITVVGIVAITVYALLRRFRPAPESMDPASVRSGPATEAAAIAHVGDPLPRGELRIPAMLVRLMLPIAGLVSVYFLLRGHNAPGGGFVGGLIMATGVIAQYMVGGTIWVESRLSIHPLAMIGAGLLAATGGRVERMGELAPLSHGPRHYPASALARRPASLDCPAVRSGRLSAGRRRHVADPRGHGTSVTAPTALGAEALMEYVYAMAIGILTGSGVWLLLRPRTFQVLLGLTLLSYATNLFIFGMGRLTPRRAPILDPVAGPATTLLYTDPVPQALVLTAIVIGFATTALLLVVLLALRGLAGSDNVDGREKGS